MLEKPYTCGTMQSAMQLRRMVDCHVPFCVAAARNAIDYVQRTAYSGVHRKN